MKKISFLIMAILLFTVFSGCIEKEEEYCENEHWLKTTIEEIRWYPESIDGNGTYYFVLEFDNKNVLCRYGYKNLEICGWFSEVVDDYDYCLEHDETFFNQGENPDDVAHILYWKFIQEKKDIGNIIKIIMDRLEPLENPKEHRVIWCSSCYDTYHFWADKNNTLMTWHDDGKEFAYDIYSGKIKREVLIDIEDSNAKLVTWVDIEGDSDE